QRARAHVPDGAARVVAGAVPRVRPALHRAPAGSGGDRLRMFDPGFEAAHLPAPRGRGSDPSWLQGVARGQPAFLLGGAGGLVESAGLRAARNRLVLGSNWTLRALVPSAWHVVDAGVWKAERSHLARCPDALVVIANRSIFGGGPYSVAGRASMRM